MQAVYINMFTYINACVIKEQGVNINTSRPCVLLRLMFSAKRLL